MDRKNYFFTLKNHTNEKNVNNQQSSLTTTTTTTAMTTIHPQRPNPSLASISNNNKMIILKSLETNQTIVLNENESATLICLSEGGNFQKNYFYFQHNECLFIF